MFHTAHCRQANSPAARQSPGPSRQLVVLAIVSMALLVLILTVPFKVGVDSTYHWRFWHTICSGHGEACLSEADGPLAVARLQP
jgi:hypothetical protein